MAVVSNREGGSKVGAYPDRSAASGVRSEAREVSGLGEEGGRRRSARRVLRAEKARVAFLAQKVRQGEAEEGNGLLMDRSENAKDHRLLNRTPILGAIV